MIRIKNVSLFYDTVQGTVKAVEDVSFELYDGEIVGVAGESGCGKTTLMKGIYGNIERPMYLAQGSIELEIEENGRRELIPSTEFHRYWWKHLSYFPQASMSVMNPVVRIKDQFLIFANETHSVRRCSSALSRGQGSVQGVEQLFFCWRNP